jgi:hypothetical protein
MRPKPNIAFASLLALGLALAFPAAARAVEDGEENETWDESWDDVSPVADAYELPADQRDAALLAHFRELDSQPIAARVSAAWELGGFLEGDEGCNVPGQPVLAKMVSIAGKGLASPLEREKSLVVLNDIASATALVDRQIINTLAARPDIRPAETALRAKLSNAKARHGACD